MDTHFFSIYQARKFSRDDKPKGYKERLPFNFYKDNENSIQPEPNEL
jgi:hypothetical protein